MTPHHRRRTCTICVALLILVASLAGRRALAQEVDAPPISRVRSGDPSITALIERGVTHSPTLHRLVASVEASDGIVYVESGRCPARVAACLLNWMNIERWEPVRAYRRRSQAARLRLAAARRDRARIAARSRGARRSVRHRRQEDVLLLSAIRTDPAGPVRNAGRDQNRSEHSKGTACLAQTRVFAALKDSTSMSAALLPACSRLH